MRFPFGLVLVLFAASSGAPAQYTYIVPIAGSASGFGSQYSTEITAVNPNSTPATLRYEAFYPTPGPLPCTVHSTQVILPRSESYVPTACFQLHAMLLSSDQPLKVKEIVFGLVRETSGLARFQMQAVEIANDWIAPDTDALISRVRMFTPPDKANLILVNPNDFLLTVTLHVERPELLQSADYTFQVQPRSLLMSPVAQIPTPVPIDELPIVFNAVHLFTVRANGKFCAGVSNTFSGTPIYIAAIPLQP
jgi:hypothetical protein